MLALQSVQDLRRRELRRGVSPSRSAMRVDLNQKWLVKWWIANVA